jgi:hypothetical protein
MYRVKWDAVPNLFDTPIVFGIGISKHQLFVPNSSTVLHNIPFPLLAHCFAIEKYNPLYLETIFDNHVVYLFIYSFMYLCIYMWGL